MYMVRIFVIDEFLDKLCEILYEFGFIEINRASRFISYKDGVHLLDNSNLIRECEELKADVKEAMSLLGVPPLRKDDSLVKISTGAMEELKEEYTEVISQIKNLTQCIKDNDKKIKTLTMRATILNVIGERGVNLDSFRKSENIIVKAGVIPKEHLKDIKSIHEEGIVIEVTEEFMGNVFLLCVALKEKEKRFIEILKSVKFKDISLDSDITDIDRSISSLELEIWRLREESANYRRQLNSIRQKYSVKLAQALWMIEENEKIYRVMGKFIASARGHVIIGWVPETKITFLENKLKGLKGAFYIDKSPAEYFMSRGLHIKDIPSYLGHKFLGPFERMLKFYGIPAYRHIDPTFLMAVSFVVMFGMMFGDVGHGLGLLAFGGVLNFFKTLRDAGRILILCGFSGMVFGILFGSFFGKEDIIFPLWFNPSFNPKKFLVVGIGFGVAMISLGIVLNIIQNIRNRHVKEAIFSQWGIISIVFYWLILYVAVASVRYHLNIPGVWIMIFFLLPLFVIVFGNLLWKCKNDLADVIFTPVEIVMSLLTNTISFIRVAAFGLAHAALGACVYLVAYSIGNIAGLKMSLIVEGNIGIILFEGLIVFIQALRLEFYEFFSKFFILQGREFKPLKERR